MKLSNSNAVIASDQRERGNLVKIKIASSSYSKRLLAMTHMSIFWILLISLVFYLFTLPHYGLTWDEPLHLKSGLIDIKNWQGQNIPWLQETFAYGPLAETLGALSFLIFSSTLHLLPFDVAFHLPIVLFGVWGIYIVYLIGRDFFSEKVGLWSAFFLALLPRYVGHLHNNIKDVPCAVLFATAIYLFSKFFYCSNRQLAVRTSHCVRRIYLIAATLFTGLALNQKINAIEIFPVVGIAYILSVIPAFILKGNAGIYKIDPRVKPEDDKVEFLLLCFSFFLSLFVAFILWPRLWSDPLSQIQQVISHFHMAWNGNSVAYFGKYYLAGIDLPWTYALAMIAITTPVYILGFSIIGIIRSIAGLLKKEKKTYFYLLLLLWFFLPTLKYLIPSLVVYDDIRQFMEVVFPLVLFTGIGIDWLINSINYVIARPPKTAVAIPTIKRDCFVVSLLAMTKYKFVSIILLLLFVTHFVYVEKNYFPYETSYFNVLVGGLKGADKQIFDPDFWANPVKEASVWLNKNAPLNSSVDVLLAREVADYYLRSDFKRLVNNEDIFNADYVILLNRPSLFWLNNNLRNTYKFMYSHKPVYTIQRDNTVLLFIYTK